jgi:hypothetical protein
MTPEPRVASTLPDVRHEDLRDLVRRVFQTAVDEGIASWHHRADGIFECRLVSGETYLLTTEGVTRTY